MITLAKIGYARVSTEEQNEARQIAAFKEQHTDKVFIDKMSGKNKERPQLKAMLDFIREGDTVIVTELSRLARSTKDMFDIINQLESKNVQLVSLKESFDTSNPYGKFTLTIFAAIAELERETILLRQREGIEQAKKEGKYKGRKPLPFNEKRFKAECEKWRSGEQTATAAMRILNMKSNRFYRYAKKYGYFVSKK